MRSSEELDFYARQLVSEAPDQGYIDDTYEFVDDGLLLPSPGFIDEELSDDVSCHDVVLYSECRSVAANGQEQNGSASATAAPVVLEKTASRLRSTKHSLSPTVLTHLQPSFSESYPLQRVSAPASPSVSHCGAYLWNRSPLKPFRIPPASLSPDHEAHCVLGVHFGANKHQYLDESLLSRDVSPCCTPPPTARFEAVKRFPLVASAPRLSSSSRTQVRSEVISRGSYSPQQFTKTPCNAAAGITTSVNATSDAVPTADLSGDAFPVVYDGSTYKKGELQRLDLKQEEFSATNEDGSVECPADRFLDALTSNGFLRHANDASPPSSFEETFSLPPAASHSPHVVELLNPQLATRTNPTPPTEYLKCYYRRRLSTKDFSGSTCFGSDVITCSLPDFLRKSKTSSSSSSNADFAAEHRMSPSTGVAQNGATYQPGALEAVGRLERLESPVADLQFLENDGIAALPPRSFSTEEKAPSYELNYEVTDPQQVDKTVCSTASYGRTSLTSSPRNAVSSFSAGCSADSSTRMHLRTTGYVGNSVNNKDLCELNGGILGSQGSGLIDDARYRKNQKRYRNSMPDEELDENSEELSVVCMEVPPLLNQCGFQPISLSRVEPSAQSPGPLAAGNLKRRRHLFMQRKSWMPLVNRLPPGEDCLFVPEHSSTVEKEAENEENVVQQCEEPRSPNRRTVFDSEQRLGLHSNRAQHTPSGARSSTCHQRLGRSSRLPSDRPVQDRIHRGRVAAPCLLELEKPEVPLNTKAKGSTHDDADRVIAPPPPPCSTPKNNASKRKPLCEHPNHVPHCFSANFANVSPCHPPPAASARQNSTSLGQEKGDETVPISCLHEDSTFSDDFFPTHKDWTPPTPSVHLAARRRSVPPLRSHQQKKGAASSTSLFPSSLKTSVFQEQRSESCEAAESCAPQVCSPRPAFSERRWAAAEMLHSAKRSEKKTLRQAPFTRSTSDQIITHAVESYANDAFSNTVPNEEPFSNSAASATPRPIPRLSTTALSNRLPGVLLSSNDRSGVAESLSHQNTVYLGLDAIDNAPLASTHRLSKPSPRISRSPGLLSSLKRSRRLRITKAASNNALSSKNETTTIESVSRHKRNSRTSVMSFGCQAPSAHGVSRHSEAKPRRNKKTSRKRHKTATKPAKEETEEAPLQYFPLSQMPRQYINRSRYSLDQQKNRLLSLPQETTTTTETGQSLCSTRPKRLRQRPLRWWLLEHIEYRRPEGSECPIPIGVHRRAEDSLNGKSQSKKVAMSQTNRDLQSRKVNVCLSKKKRSRAERKQNNLVLDIPPTSSILEEEHNGGLFSSDSSSAESALCSVNKAAADSRDFCPPGCKVSLTEATSSAGAAPSYNEPSTLSLPANSSHSGTYGPARVVAYEDLKFVEIESETSVFEVALVFETPLYSVCELVLYPGQSKGVDVTVSNILGQVVMVEESSDSITLATKKKSETECGKCLLQVGSRACALPSDTAVRLAQSFLVEQMKGDRSNRLRVAGRMKSKMSVLDATDFVVQPLRESRSTSHAVLGHQSANELNTAHICLLLSRGHQFHIPPGAQYNFTNLSTTQPLVLSLTLRRSSTS